MANTCDDSDSKGENLKSVPPPPHSIRRQRGSGTKGRRNACARKCGARGRMAGREEKRVSTTGGGRPDVMSAAAQRDKQLNVAVDENPSHRVFIHPSVVQRVCHEPKARNDHQFRPRLRRTRSCLSVSLSLSFPLSLSVPSVRALNYIYIHSIHT